MQGRGVPPSAVEDAIQNGQSSPGNSPDTTVHQGDGVTVVTGENGQVIMKAQNLRLEPMIFDPMILWRRIGGLSQKRWTFL